MSVIRDLKSKLGMSCILAPIVRTADATSTELDTQDSVSVCLLAMLGIPGDTLSGSVKIEFEVQHSDTSGSGYVACADTDINAPVTGTNPGTFASIQASPAAASTYKCNYIGNKRYVKVVANVSGTHTNGTGSAVAAILEAAHQPAA